MTSRFRAWILTAALGAAFVPSTPAQDVFPANASDGPSLGDLMKRSRFAFSGLRVVPIHPGAGERPAPNSEVLVHYTGWLADGTLFDSSRDGEPLLLPLGSGEVIRAFETVGEMRKGERWYLIVPPEMGYGAKGMGMIPPNATLIFDVELVDF